MTDLFMIRRASFSDDGKHRFRLEREWGIGPKAVYCGKNPSTADSDKEDPSLHRMIFTFRRLGFGGVIVVNADTLITPNPIELYRAWDTWGPLERRELRERALQVAFDAMDGAPLIIAGWGNSPTEFGQWHSDFRHWLEQRGVVFSHFGLTQSGAPKHIHARGLHRIPDDQQPIRWTA